MSADKKKFFSTEYVREVAMKIVDNLLSVKVWIIIGIFALTTKLLIGDHINGGEFVTINVSLTGIAVAMREVFKVNKVRAMSLNGESKHIPDMKA